MIWWIPLAMAAVSAMQKQQQTQEMHKANSLKAQELSQGGGDWQEQIAQALAKKKEDEWVGGPPQGGLGGQGGFYG